MVGNRGFIFADAMESRHDMTGVTDVNGTLAAFEAFRIFSAIVSARAAVVGESSRGCWVSAAKVAEVDDNSSGIGF